MCVLLKPIIFKSLLNALFHASGDGYTKRTTDITENVENLKKCIDDSCLYSDTIEKCFWQMVEYIDL